MSGSNAALRERFDLVRRRTQQTFELLLQSNRAWEMRTWLSVEKNSPGAPGSKMQGRFCLLKFVSRRTFRCYNNEVRPAQFHGEVAEWLKAAVC